VILLRAQPQQVPPSAHPPPELVEAAVHCLEELVEMLPLAADPACQDLLVEEVQHHGLPSADAAVHVEPSWHAHGGELGILPGGDARSTAAAAAAASTAATAEHVTQGATQ